MAFEKIKQSKHRLDIERMLAEGVSPRKISSWLLTQGCPISYLLIHEYRKKEFNFVRAAVQEMKPPSVTSSKIFEEGKRGILDDIRFCNKVIEIADKKIESLNNDPGGMATLKTLAEAAFRAIEIKRKLAGEGDSHGSVTIGQLNFQELKIGISERLREIEQLEALEAKATCDG